ncbi:hypothetical protein M6B38_187215 [Iris pallida]|uniref:Uncharacterized protein n=1 Tax=Iris pallida TaxID=29817 RepID=A0AAX6EJN6_IRIPA|nr:hypothetical protein M6B38_187215 [Iris pallida]
MVDIVTTDSLEQEMLGKMTYPQISVRELVLVELLQFTRESKKKWGLQYTQWLLSASSRSSSPGPSSCKSMLPVLQWIT